MSLKWDASRVTQWKSYTEDQRQAIVNGIVWHSVILDFNEVTEKNHQQVYARISLWEAALGSLLNESVVDPDDATKVIGFEPYFITLDDVKRAIGLTTNASASTDAQFTKKLWKAYTEKLKREAKAADAAVKAVTRA